MQRYFIRLSYRGTNYHGWQKQPNATTVQGVLEEALGKIMRRELPLTGCGRTDTGVHARVFYAHFDSEKPLPMPDDLTYKLNAVLPDDIAVQQVFPVQPEAHARYSAIERGYEYHIHLRKDPFADGLSLQLRHVPDVEAMNQACKLLTKTRDFSSFARLHADTKTNICHLSHAAWERNDDRLVFRVRADRFLRNMVRAMVGTLLQLGSGKLSAEGFSDIINARDRSAAGVSADAHGLFLTGVDYPETFFK